MSGLQVTRCRHCGNGIIRDGDRWVLVDDWPRAHASAHQCVRTWTTDGPFPEHDTWGDHEPHPACDRYVPASGGAWPWCDTCGWRFDHHADIDPDLAATAQRKGLAR